MKTYICLSVPSTKQEVFEDDVAINAVFDIICVCSVEAGPEGHVVSRAPSQPVSVDLATGCSSGGLPVIVVVAAVQCRLSHPGRSARV